MLSQETQRPCYSGVANPSEREPHWPTSEESKDFSKAEAVTECKGIKESAEPNSLGNLAVKKRFWQRESRGLAEGMVGASPRSLEDPAGEETDREVEFTKALA